MCYTWAGYDEMGAKYYLSFRGKKTANDFNITLLVSTFLNPLIEMAFQDHLKKRTSAPPLHEKNRSSAPPIHKNTFSAPPYIKTEHQRHLNKKNRLSAPPI